MCVLFCEFVDLNIYIFKQDVLPKLTNSYKFQKMPTFEVCQIPIVVNPWKHSRHHYVIWRFGNCAGHRRIPLALTMSAANDPKTPIPP